MSRANPVWEGHRQQHREEPAPGGPDEQRGDEYPERNAESVRQAGQRPVDQHEHYQRDESMGGRRIVEQRLD